MEAFGIVGLSFGLMGFVFALNALQQVSSLEKRLVQSGVLEEESEAV